MNFKTGDHIYVNRVLYTHHGIYIGNNEIVHFDNTPEAEEKGTITLTSLSAFAKGDKVKKYNDYGTLRGTPFSPEDIVERALSKVGEKDYHLFFNNCEHFANWCTHGDEYSLQTSGTADFFVRKGIYFVAGGLNVFDIIEPFKRFWKK